MNKSFEELLEYIKSNTSSEFDELLVKAKEEDKKRNIWFWSLAIIIDVFLLIFLYNFIRNTSCFSMLPFIFPIFMIDMLLFIILSFCFSKNKKEYISAFKENVILKLLKNFYYNVHYMPQKLMPKDIYNSAKYNEYYNEYHSDDYMDALINDKFFIKMAEVHTVDVETSTDSDGNTTTTRTTKFHGMFAQIKMEKSINSDLLIRRNHSISKKNRLDMDSQEFEKVFDVSATNQIIGMQLLTHDIMELLLSFKKSTGINYDISIYNDVMYLRFHTGSMFEFKSFKKGPFDEKILRQYYNVLNFTSTLSKMLIDLIEKTEI